MPVILVLVVAAVLFAAGIALLALYLGRRSSQGRGRTIGMCTGIAAGLVGGGLLLDATSAYYARPLGLTVLLAVIGAAVVVQVVLVARAAGRSARGILALGGLVVLGVMLAAGIVVLGQVLELTPYPWETRARQIGEAAGFVPLLADGRVPRIGYERVAMLAGPDAGLVMSYDDFEVQERRAPEVMHENAMRAIAAVGEDPLGNGSVVTPSVTYEMVQVGAWPALMVRWQPDIPGAGYMTETVTLLLFKAGEADVRVWSSQVEKPGAGDISPHAGLSPEQLLGAAETLQPME